MKFCFSSERTCLLLRVVFQQHIASPWAASVPPWVPCHRPTCTNTHWSPNTTKSPRQRSMRSLQVTFLCLHPMLPRWLGPTSVAWVQSLSWSLHRTGMVQLSSLSSSGDKTVQQGMVMDYSSRKEARRGAEMDWLTWCHHLQIEINSFGSLLLCWEEIMGNHNRAHKLITNKWSFMNFSSWVLTLISLSYYTLHMGMSFYIF